MDNEHIRHETDARLRAALTPDEATRQRLVAAALRTEHHGPARRQRLWQVAFLCAAAALVAFAIRTWPWRPTTPGVASRLPPTSLTFVNRGPLLVVDSHDGRRWIVGPSPESSNNGGYVIAIWK